MVYKARERLTFPSLKSSLFLVTDQWWVLVSSTYTRQISCKLGLEFFRDLCFLSCGSSRLCQQELRTRWSTKVTQACLPLKTKSVEWLPEGKARCIPCLGNGNL